MLVALNDERIQAGGSACVESYLQHRSLRRPPRLQEFSVRTGVAYLLQDRQERIQERRNGIPGQHHAPHRASSPVQRRRSLLRKRLP